MVLPAKVKTLRVQRVWASMSSDCSQLVKMASQNKKVLSLTLDAPGSNTLPNDSWQHFRLYTPLCKELIMSRVNLEGQGESTVLWVTLWAFIFPVSLLVKNMTFVLFWKKRHLPRGFYCTHSLWNVSTGDTMKVFPIVISYFIFSLLLCHYFHTFSSQDPCTVSFYIKTRHHPMSL